MDALQINWWVTKYINSKAPNSLQMHKKNKLSVFSRYQNFEKFWNEIYQSPGILSSMKSPPTDSHYLYRSILIMYSSISRVFVLGPGDHIRNLLGV